jgi:hypothetical protein
VIYKGKPSTELKASNNQSWHFGYSENGWTSNVIGIEWTQQVFESATQTDANGQWGHLICNGHDSHLSAKFVLYSYCNSIHLVHLHPHSSCLTQPLDVSVSGPLKKAFSRYFLKFFAMGVNCVEKF